eukprot:TRINITY_DN5916_c0_g1_i1.p1 TRINITY_DN5916_c0_g1~~TRINITY_DN5916_c0_g1_i1.p1  ORF type:complete len:319 (+),score=65.92 TRINITY_DN5916_c0_g1_i1:39-995(+)
MFNDCALTQIPRDKTKLLRTIDELEHQRATSLLERDYDQAAALHKRQGDAVLSDERQQMSRERSRQDIENLRFENGTHQMLTHLDEKWKEIVSSAEDTWCTRLQALEEKQVQQRLDLENELQVWAAKQKCIHSAYVRDMHQAEQKLAAGHEYDECKMIRRKIQVVEKDEVTKFEAGLQQTMDRKRQQLAGKQERERQQLLVQQKGERVALMRRRQEERTQLLQQFANLRQDMQDAHATEFRLASAAAVSIPLKEELRRKKLVEMRERQGLPHGTPLSKAATYRGTQLLKRAQAQSPLPSLAELYDPDDPATPNYSPPF